jgi:hypothetical protein
MKKNRIEFSVSFTFFASAAFFLSGELSLNYAYALFFSFLHEAGHLVAMIFFGCYPKKISLGIAGIRIDKTDFSLSFMQECIVALCGPFVNLVLMLIFSENFSSLPFIINSGLLFVNLLPVKSLDGGRFIYNLILLKHNGSTADRFLQITEIMTILLICAVLAVSFFIKKINTSFILFSVLLVVMILSEVFQYIKA